MNIPSQDPPQSKRRIKLWAMILIFLLILGLGVFWVNRSQLIHSLSEPRFKLLPDFILPRLDLTISREVLLKEWRYELEEMKKELENFGLGSIQRLIESVEQKVTETIKNGFEFIRELIPI